MKAKAALVTGKGAAAISCVSVVGEAATEAVFPFLKKSNQKEFTLQVGQLQLADFVYEDRLIDQVVVAYESENLITINAHGNPIIIEQILKALSSAGVEVVSSEEFMAEQYGSESKLAIEVKIDHSKSKTLEGAKLILHQAKSGLLGFANNVFETKDLEQIKLAAKEVLKRSKVANLIINGARVVIAGAPNSGKSTLLNQLCGREKAIVADIEGTTRDWVRASCSVESLWLDLYDTAGLDDSLAEKTELDRVSQEITKQVISKADIIVYLFDATNVTQQKINATADILPDFIPTIAVLNKIDVQNSVESLIFSDKFSKVVSISAVNGDGVDVFIESIREVLGVVGFDLSAPVCFNSRQSDILKRITVADDIEEIKQLAGNLIKG